MILDRPVHRRYEEGICVSLGDAPFRLRSLRLHQDRALLQVDGIATMDQAETMRGRDVTISRSDVPLEPGEYLLQDLVGCDVIDHSSGHLYGEVADWRENGPQTLLEVHTASAGPLLIPLVPAICLDVRPAGRLIRVTLPEGLAQLNDAPAGP